MTPVSEHSTDPTDSGEPQFIPSAEFSVSEGRRDVGVCFLGASMTAGYGDPKGLGWVGRVVSRTQHPDLDLTAYNLGVRGDTSADVMARWRAETAPRWTPRAERRLVLSVGANDIAHGVSTARSRLNLANILDEATTSGIAAFVVGLTPSLDSETNGRIEALAEAQADVCSRRGSHLRRLLPPARRPRPVAVRPQRLPRPGAPRAGGLRAHRLARPAQRLVRLDAHLLLTLARRGRTRYNVFLTKRDIARMRRLRRWQRADRSQRMAAQEWRIEGPRVLDIGGEGERVERLEVGIVAGRVDVVTHDDSPTARVEVTEVEGLPGAGAAGTAAGCA